MKQGTICCMAGALLFAASSASADVQGYWLSEEGTAQVEMAPCDDDPDMICGHIVWLEDPLDDDGEPLRDVENEDPDKRDREILGSRIVWDMEQDSREGRWSGGRIYDPESGDTYRARMDLKEDGQVLDLRGYVGIPTFGRSSEWTREDTRRE